MMSNVQVINTPSLNLVNGALDQRPKSLLTLMEELSQVMNLFEEVIAQFDTKEQEYHADAANISAQVSQKMADKARAQIKKIAAEKEKAEHRSLWGKIVKDVAPALGITVGLVLCFVLGPEVGIPIMLLSLALAFELPQKLAGLIAKALEALGVPEKLAKPLADLIVFVMIVAVMVFTAGAGAPEEGAELAAEEGAEEGTEEGASEKTLVNKVLEGIGKRGGMGLTASSQLLGSLNFSGDIINAIPMSDEKREKFGLILEIVQMVTSLLMGIVGGGALAANPAAQLGEESSLFTKVQQLLLDHPTVLTATLSAIEASAGTASAAYQFVSSFDKYKISDYMKKLAPIQANQMLASDTVKLADQSVQQSSKQYGIDIEAIDEMLNTVYHMTDVMGAVAEKTSA